MKIYKSTIFVNMSNELLLNVMNTNNSNLPFKPASPRGKVETIQRMFKTFSSRDISDFSLIVAAYMTHVIGRPSGQAEDEAHQLVFALTIDLD